ncbi:ATP-grasp domain-containing protein [Streptacidiphilus jiangxiensis]|uniref:Biotin carboxylase n=1 Tax=Streptacidiphilus jiangxiensis TaxID=235985 RepID=A0A1H7VLH6_STRJI|nr:ATP-grasp domain-containing protein [Streptacidiphilus jiangxiensis]SEM10096.1 Biotin carboxylase [Streptacidiphilus jiangxiensis]
MTPPLIVAIVDADGIGAHLPAALARHGARSIHVRSDAPNVHFSRRPADLDIEVVHRGDLVETATALRGHGVGFVVAGTESGVLLADALSAQLRTPGNGMTRPGARRDKHEMVQAVAAVGLATASSVVTDSLDELLTWAEQLGTWPVVLKPPASAASDHVLFCRSEAELRSAFAAVLGADDRYGRRNGAVIGQEFLAGEEYFVNTVSRGGSHHVVEVWRYQKRLVDGGRPMYDYEEPVAPDDPAVAVVSAYALAVLDALEIRNGAAHTEVMLTPDGPVLVESAARPGGSHEPAVVSGCLGTDQIDCLARAIVRPEELHAGRLPRYRPQAALRYVTLLSPTDGQMPSEEGLAPVRELESCLEVVLAAAPGSPVKRTVDLGTSPGYVYLTAATHGEVEEDYHRLRQLEESGLYRTPTH